MDSFEKIEEALEQIMDEYFEKYFQNLDIDNEVPVRISNPFLWAMIQTLNDSNETPSRDYTEMDAVEDFLQTVAFSKITRLLFEKASNGSVH
jgi:hypothetical protein